MNCRNIRKRLSALQDGECDPRSTRKIEDHLRKCPRCRGEYDSLGQTVNTLLATGTIDPHPGFIPSVMERIRSPKRSLPGFSPSFVYATVFVFCLIFGFWLNSPRPPEVTPASPYTLSRLLNENRQLSLIHVQNITWSMIRTEMVNAN